MPMFTEGVSHRVELDRFLEDKPFYKSADIPAVGSYVIPPGAAVDVVFAYKPLELPILDEVPIDQLGGLHMATRSRWALAGLETGAHRAGRSIPGRINRSYPYDKDQQAFLATLPVFNYSRRPVAVPDGSRLFKYYYLNPANKIQGDELIDAIVDGSIKIQGGFPYYDLPENVGDWPGVVRLRAFNGKTVDPANQRSWSVPNAGEFRSHIENELTDVPELGTWQLVIAETSPIEVQEGFAIELQPWVKAFGPTRDHSRNIQTDSRLLDGGYEWPIKVEIDTFPVESDEFYELIANVYKF